MGLDRVTECSDLLKLAAVAPDVDLLVVVKPLGCHRQVFELRDINAEVSIAASSGELARGNATFDKVDICSDWLRQAVALGSRAESRHIVVKPLKRHWEHITGATDNLEVLRDIEVLTLPASSEPG